jgi:hypothetical protein
MQGVFMKPSFTHALCRVALSACLLAPAAHAAKPMDSWDGLQLREGRGGLDAVYVRPGVKFAPYKSVQIDPVVVEFSKNWGRKARDSERQLSAAELQEIRGKLAKLMREVFVQELVAHGYTVVEVAAEDTLRITTALSEVFINSLKDSPTDVKTYAPGAGSMTLVLEARDGPTGQLLARVIDQRMDEHAADRAALNSAVADGAAAREAFEIWARQLREALDRLNSKAR